MSEKYRGTDAVILRHPSGQVLRLDPARVDDKVLTEAKRAGWQPYDPPKDGFRKRKKRTKADMRRLIDEGIVATEPQTPQTYGPETFVVDVPLGSLSGGGQDLGR